MASECRKTCGDMDLPSKLGLVDTAWPPHDVCRAETRQALVVGPDEDWLRLMMAEAAFAQQGRQRSHQILRHGNDAVSALLAVKKHLRTAPLQLKIVRVDADRFGHAGAGSGQKKQKDPVAPAAGCRLIGGHDNGVHFRAGQVMRHLDVGPFSRDRQDPLGHAEGGRIGSGDVVEERSDRSEPGIAAGDRVVPLFLRERGPDRDHRVSTPPGRRLSRGPQGNHPRARTARLGHPGAGRVGSAMGHETDIAALFEERKLG
jgi:hypothetical protein